MLVQLLMAFLGETVFGAIAARHRGFRAEMERYLEEGSVVSSGKISSGKTPTRPAR
jgi:hypothetical protein